MTPYERGQIAAEMAILLEEIAADPSIPSGYRTEARRLVDLADEAWSNKKSAT